MLQKMAVNARALPEKYGKWHMSVYENESLE
jgi:hypothetical protein